MPSSSRFQMSSSIDVAQYGREMIGAGGHLVRHELLIDPSERHAALVDLLSQCGDFDVRIERLPVGDYCLDRGVVVERKTYADFAVSLADGRLFPQAAKLARCPHRPIILLRVRDHSACRRFIRMHSRVRWPRWPSRANSARPTLV